MVHGPGSNGRPPDHSAAVSTRGEGSDDYSNPSMSGTSNVPLVTVKVVD